MAPKKISSPNLQTSVQTTHELLASLRERIAALKTEKEQIEKCPVPLAEGLARANRGLDILRERLLEKFIKPTSLFSPSDDGLSIRHSLEGLSAFNLSLLLQPAVLKQQVEDLLNQQFYHLNGISASERTAKLKELTITLHDLEVSEEQIITASEAASITIDRREDVRPEIILTVGVDEPVPTMA